MAQRSGIRRLISAKQSFKRINNFLKALYKLYSQSDMYLKQFILLDVSVINHIYNQNSEHAF